MAGSKAGTLQVSCSGDDMHPLSQLVFYSGEDPRDSEPLNVPPFTVIEEPVLLVAILQIGCFRKLRASVTFWGCLVRGLRMNWWLCSLPLK